MIQGYLRGYATVTAYLSKVLLSDDQMGETGKYKEIRWNNKYGYNTSRTKCQFPDCCNSSRFNSFPGDKSSLEAQNIFQQCSLLDIIIEFTTDFDFYIFGSKTLFDCT